jgi:hypothetical protein
LAMLAWVDAATEAGAEIMDLGRGSGEPEGPKGSLGPTRLPYVSLQAARSPVFQPVLEAVLWCRAEAWRLRRRRIRPRQREQFKQRQDTSDPQQPRTMESFD